MKCLDGKKIARQIQTALKREIKKLPHPPGLGVLLVGQNPASRVYVGRKEKVAEELGIKVKKILLPDTATTKKIISAINKFNKDTEINGLLVQLPLPPQINTDQVIATIAPEKDADGFRENSKVISPTHQAILKLMGATGKSLRGKTFYIFANSDVFKKPLEKILLAQHLWPTQKSVEADFVIVACGKPHFLKEKHIKKNATVIDVGTTFVDGKWLGDADPASLEKKAGLLSPVPGGVGPLTVIFLLKNILLLAKRHSIKK